MNTQQNLAEALREALQEYSITHVLGEAWVQRATKALAEYDAKQAGAGDEPLFLLHTGKFYGGELCEWEAEADSQQRVDEFCRRFPEQTFKLYTNPQPPALVPLTVPEFLDAAKEYAKEKNGGTLDGLQFDAEMFSEVFTAYQIGERALAAKNGLVLGKGE